MGPALIGGHTEISWQRKLSIAQALGRSRTLQEPVRKRRAGDGKSESITRAKSHSKVLTTTQ